MDVDEFLDKELQVKKEVKEDVPIETAKGEKDDIKRYFELWEKISEMKFKWSNELYDEVNKARDKAKQKLSRLLPDVGRDKNTIRHLIGKTRNELQNKNFEAATRSYSEISKLRDSFPDFLLEEKKEINKEIFRLYEELRDKIDLKFIDDFKESIAKADNLAKNSFSNLRMGKVEEAKNSYEEALKAYKDLPNGFLDRKMELGNKLLELYKELSISTQIKDLERQLGKELARGYKHVSQDNLKRLSEIAKNAHSKQSFVGREKVKERSSVLEDLRAMSGGKHSMNKILLSKLIERKLDRAKTSLRRGLYSEAKKNIDAVLKVDPGNIEAKKLLGSLHVVQ